MTAAADQTDIEYFEYTIKIEYLERCKEREVEKLKNKKPEEMKKLEKKIQEFSKLTWRKLVNLRREKGVTPENKNSISRRKIINRIHPDHPADEIYPFHFRVSNKFRVFCYQYKNVLYITHLDPEHKEHRRR